MKDFKGFIFYNNLSQKEVMEYLQVSKGYMSLVISGKKNLSEENFRKLIENPFGWDVSMLTDRQPENAMIETPETSTIVNKLFALIEDVRADNKILLAMLKEKDKKIDELQEELRRFREHKGETAHTAEDSSAATAV